MVRDLNVPVEIIAHPTVREPDGLAMSSRNKYLSPQERQEALCLRRALDLAEQRFAAGERDAQKIIAAMHVSIDQYPTATVDYIEVVDDQTLEPVPHLASPTLIALAVQFGRARLLDNTVLG